MTNTPTILPELLTAPQAAELLGIGQRTLSRWSSEGKAPQPLKLTPGQRGALRYRRADLAAWIAAGCADLRAAARGGEA